MALVSGANRGIGLEVCRQLAVLGNRVILGSRDLLKGERAVQSLKEPGLEIQAFQLDISDQSSIDGLKQKVETEYGRLDTLVNNAAILYDSWQQVVDADLNQVEEAFNTNLLGAWRMCQAFVPLLRQSPHPRIVNVSSEAGSLAGISPGTPAYNISKVSLNALTRMLATQLKNDGILVNAICPGWVATDMGGAGGRPVEQGAASVVWGVTIGDDGPTGGFFRDGQPLPW